MIALSDFYFFLSSRIFECVKICVQTSRVEGGGSARLNASKRHAFPDMNQPSRELLTQGNLGNFLVLFYVFLGLCANSVPLR